jgi:hypothetical protein
MNENLETLVLFVVIVALFFLGLWGGPLLWEKVRDALWHRGETKRLQEHALRESTKLLREASAALKESRELHEEAIKNREYN